MNGLARKHRFLDAKRRRGDRFLVFGAPLLLIAYYVAFLVVADLAGGHPTVRAAISPVPFTHEIIDPAGSAPTNMHTKTVGDIDGDGYPDVIAGGAGGHNNASETSGLFWYRNPEWTKFTVVPDDDSSTGFSTDMQSGDVDGDGDIDIIIPRAGAFGFKGVSLSWFENPLLPAGDPTTDPWVEHDLGSLYPGNTGAHDVELADLNNDNLMDIVIRFREVHTFVQIDASADQWIKTRIDTRHDEGLSLGDLDNDGDADIATNGYWLENPFIPNGAAAMETTWTEHTIDATRSIDSKTFVADINQDNQLDVLLNTSEAPGGELAWYEPSNPSDPTVGPWIKHSIGFLDYDHTLQVGDVDLDGDFDVLAAEMHQSQGDDNVVIYYNLDGAGTSWDFQVVDTNGSHNMRMIDFDLDGDLDLMGANWSGGPLSLWRNELGPLTGWSRHSVDSNRPWRGVLMDFGDFDGDGLKDIATGGWWYENPGTPGGNWTRNTIGTPLNNVAIVHDFDGDNDLDIFGTQGQGSADNSSLAWAENDGAGNFTVHTNIPTPLGDFLQGITLGPITSAQTEIYLSWHDQNPNIDRLIVPADPVNTTWTLEVGASATQEEDLSHGDIDNDTDLDILLGTRWLENTGSGFMAHDLFSPLGKPDRNELADINGDNKLDAVIGYEAISTNGKLAWYEQGATPTGLWTEHVIATIIGPMSLDVRDMDNDGDLDVVVGEHNFSNPSAARLFVYENADGVGGSWTERLVHTGDEHHDGARTVDIDNDGDYDIASIGWFDSPGGVFLYENTGSAPGQPNAVPDSYSVLKNTTLNQPAPGILGNDVMPGGGYTPSVDTNVSSGVLVLNLNGSFSYTPNTGFTGVDSFTYTISNGAETSSPATVTLNVTEQNLPPTVIPDSYTVSRGGVLEVAASGVLSNDSDPDGDAMQAQLVGAPFAGEVELNSDGSFRYIHLGGLGTLDMFKYRATDAFGTSRTVTVSLTVTGALPRETGGLQALYSFDEGSGSTVSDISGVGSALDLTIANPANVTWSAGALSIDSSTLIGSGVAATKINSAVQASGEITVEAWIKAGLASQSGPARIATISSDALNRNVTLAQEATRLDVRLRSSAGDLNGLPSTAAPNGSVETALQHVVYTRNSSGVTKIYVDGVEVASGSAAGDLSNWDANYEFGLGNEISSQSNPGHDRPWRGEFRLVAVYSDALSAVQVSNNYSAGPESTASASTASIDGTMSLHGIVTNSAAFNAVAPYITFNSGSGQQAVPVNSDGTFAVPVVDGTYTVTAYGPGFLSSQRTGVVVAGSNVVLPAVELVAGLVDSDLVVTGADLSPVLAGIGAALVGRTNGTDSNIIDLNADGVVNGQDPSVVASNLGMASPLANW